MSRRYYSRNKIITLGGCQLRASDFEIDAMLGREPRPPVAVLPPQLLEFTVQLRRLESCCDCGRYLARHEVNRCADCYNELGSPT